MALVKVGEKALEAAKAVESNKQITKHKVIKRKVLEENDYIADLEKIIQRDFFPDLEKLHSQVEYMEARDNNDIAKMREIAIKLQASTVRRQQTNTPAQFGHAASPATFETPDLNSKGVQTPTTERSHTLHLTSNPEPAESNDNQELTTRNKGMRNTNLRLDNYLSNYTSEDNASFGDLMEAASEQNRKKHAWLYEEEKRLKQENDQLLMLDGPEKLAIKCAPAAAGLNSWTYKAKNDLMYVPDGVEDTIDEKVNKKAKEREILYENTRFLSNPHKNVAQREVQARAAANRAAMKQGKIGHDGKEILESETPKVKGYGFVSVPSPAPGVHDSPLMTWGEIESTPMRLQGSETPITKTQGFKMPRTPRREELARSLVEKNVKQHRAKKEAALKNVTQRFTSPQFGSLNSLERMRTLSPAAQKLVNKQINQKTDKALRASYTPSPQQTSKDDKTPILTATPTRTPVGTACDVGSSSARTPNNTLSLTDNLLDLPKRNSRQKATDFF